MINHVKECRKEKGLTLQELADRSGAAKSYIWELEQGKSTPSIRLAYAIARAFGESVENIFPDDQEYEEVVVRTVRKVKAA
jgi:putative transcriptional regulator